MLSFREFGEVYSYRGRGLDHYPRGAAAAAAAAGTTPTYPRGATMAARGAAIRGGRGGATPRSGAAKAA